MNRVTQLVNYIRMNELFDLDYQDIEELWDIMLPGYVDRGSPRDDAERELIDAAMSRVASYLMARFGFDSQLNLDEEREFLEEMYALAGVRQTSEMARSLA